MRGFTGDLLRSLTGGTGTLLGGGFESRGSKGLTGDLLRPLVGKPVTGLAGVCGEVNRSTTLLFTGLAGVRNGESLVRLTSLTGLAGEICDCDWESFAFLGNDERPADLWGI